MNHTNEQRGALRGGDRLSEPTQAAIPSGYVGLAAEGRNLTRDQCSERSDAIPFGRALEHLKNGKRIARAGWNGVGMFVFLNEGSDPAPPQDRARTLSGIRSDLFRCGDVGTIRRLPNLNMRAADGSTVTGWLASQTDMLAEDWMVV